MEVGALADRLFHAVSEIAKCTGHALARHCEHRVQTRLVHHHVDVGLQPAEHRCLAAFRKSWIIGEMPFALVRINLKPIELLKVSVGRIGRDAGAGCWQARADVPH